MDLEKYINRSKSNDKEIWLHNLPNDKNLFDVIDNLRKQYNNLRYTFVINQEIRITGITIDSDVDFSNCIFKNEEEIENSGNIQIEPSIIFNKVKFKGIVDFSNTSLYGIKFENVDFIGEGKNIFFKNSSLYDDIKFKNVNFNFSTHFNNSEIEKLSFEDTTFKGNTNFREISFNGETKFLNCTFTSLQNDTSGEVSFSGSTFKQKVEFLESKFQIKTSFSYFEKKDELRLEATNFERDAIFSNCTFGQNNTEGKTIPSIHFSNAKFNQKVKFSFSTFNSEVIFKNTKFKDLLYFHKVDFYQSTQFYFTDFTKKVFFSNTHFFEEIQFLYCEVESSSFIRFESSIFEKCLEISRSNFDYCKLRFWDIQIKGEDKINEYTNYEKDFGETLIEPSVYSKIRESFRFIKSTFYAENNKIEGLRFYEKEMSVYLEEKRAEDKKSKQSKDKEELMTLNSNLTTTTSNKKGLNNIRKEYVNTYNFLSLIELFFLMICIIPLFLIVNPFLFILPIFYIPILICAKKCRNMHLKRYMFDKTSVLIKKVSLYIAIVIRICFYRLISFKSKKHSLFIVAFFVIILFLGVVYITLHKYIWYWLTLFLFALWVYLEFYQNRENVKNSIKSNNYLFLIMFSIPMIIIFVRLYGINDYKNDWIYKILKYLSVGFSTTLTDLGSFIFVLTVVFILLAIGFSIFPKIHDKIVLWFNKNSNEFDTNWITGVNFSILVGVITYFMVLLFMNDDIELDTSHSGISNFITSLVDVFNLTKWVNLEIIGIRLKGIPYLLLFIGRIFIGYGYYQTIQAFRKFGKS